MTSREENPSTTTSPSEPHLDPTARATTSETTRSGLTVPGTSVSSQSSRPSHRPLNQAVAGLDLDVLQELERFRRWQHKPAADPATLLNDRLSPYLHPEEVVEDLELDDARDQPSAWISSPLALLCIWLLSCGGLGISVWWLFSPGSPNQVIVRARPTPTLTPVPTPTPSSGINLLRLPIFPIPATKTVARAAKDILPSPLPTQEPPPVAQVTPAPSLTPAPVVAITKPATPNPLDNLDPAGGEGTFLVLVNYSGESSLAQARQVSQGAFLKTIGGTTYVQMATFKQVEYARYMVDELSRKGFTAIVQQQS